MPGVGLGGVPALGQHRRDPPCWAATFRCCLPAPCQIHRSRRRQGQHLSGACPRTCPLPACPRTCPLPVCPLPACRLVALRLVVCRLPALRAGTRRQVRSRLLWLAGWPFRPLVDPRSRWLWPRRRLGFWPVQPRAGELAGLDRAASVQLCPVGLLRRAVRTWAFPSHDARQLACGTGRWAASGSCRAPWPSSIHWFILQTWPSETGRALA